MIFEAYLYLYGLNLKELVSFILLIAVFWTFGLGYLFTNKRLAPFAEKYRRPVCITLLVIALYGIFYLTIEMRMGIEPNVKPSIWIIPFQIFRNGADRWGMAQTYLLNVLLFEPLGILLPNALSSTGKISWMNALCSFGMGILLSVLIEVVQYRYCLGYVETDDVIFNAMGMLIGIIAAKGVSATSRKWEVCHKN